MRRRLAIAAIPLLAMLVAASAHAQDVPRRAIATRFESGVPRVSVDATDLADRALRRHLQSGLPQHIVTRVYAYGSAASVPIAVAVRSCTVTFDPWSLNYRVRVQTARTDHSSTMSSLDAVIGACLRLEDLPIGVARNWDGTHGRSVWFAAIVELNPVLPDTVVRIRRWLAQPDGRGIEGDAFFGSFVSLFVNRRIGEAEQTFQFRSDGEVVCP